MGKEKRSDGMPAEKIKKSGYVMSPHELKLNKQLLKEISATKKRDGVSTANGASLDVSLERIKAVE